MTYPWLGLRTVLDAAEYARELGVSEVARSRGGFVAAYTKAKGRVPDLGLRGTRAWRELRNGFVSRHMAQAVDEDLWLPGGRPTRRHVALAVWAYSPEPKRLRAFLARWRAARG